MPNVILYIVVSCPNPETPATEALPAEFILNLGPQSSMQVATLARILKDLGAQVDVDAQGGLVAHRPQR